MDALWAATRGAHEAVVRVLHHMILFVVPVLEPPLRMYLFSLISRVPYREYSEQTLHLIKAYTVQALAALRDEATRAARSGPAGAPGTPAGDSAGTHTSTSKGSPTKEMLVCSGACSCHMVRS